MGVAVGGVGENEEIFFSFEANAKAKKEVLYNPTYKVCQKFQKEKKNQSLSLLLARCVTCVCL